MELVDEERVGRHVLSWGKDQKESTIFKETIQSCDIRRFTCFSEIQNWVLIVEKKIGFWKAHITSVGCWMVWGNAAPKSCFLPRLAFPQIPESFLWVRLSGRVWRGSAQPAEHPESLIQEKSVVCQSSLCEKSHLSQ